MQFDCMHFALLHLHQFGGVRARSMEDAGCLMVHSIRTGWKAKKVTSAVAVDVTQYFSSLNYGVLQEILRWLDFPATLGEFFGIYLTNCSTHFLFNQATSNEYHPSVGIRQGSLLLPIH